MNEVKGIQIREGLAAQRAERFNSIVNAQAKKPPNLFFKFLLAFKFHKDVVRPDKKLFCYKTLFGKTYDLYETSYTVIDSKEEYYAMFK